MPGGVELGSAFIPIRADLDDLKKDLDQAHSQLAAGLGNLAKVGVAAGAGIAAGLGVALGAAFKIGEQFDAAFDSIRTTTGKTGEALEGLKGDFRAVAAQVPQDFDKVGQVVADLNQRTGSTGDGLQALAKQMLDFSRVTGTDVSSNISLATRLFGDWSVATENQAGTMDKMFRASQATGIGVDALMGKVVQFGAPLRAMGFSLDESAALLGKWEKEGVNSELVLGSMRIAMGNFAKDNIPMREGLDQTIASITALGPGADATTLAMQTFGARAGPDMAAAILEGRFALGDLLGTISNGSETVSSAANETADFAEKWATFSNRARLAIEPVVAKVFDLAGTLMDRLAPALEAGLAALAPMAAAFVDWLGPALDNTFTAISNLSDFLNANVMPALSAVTGFVQDHLGPILSAAAVIVTGIVVPAFIAWAAAAVASASATVLALAPVLIPLAAIAAAVALLKIAWDSNFGDIQGKTVAVWDVVQPILAAVFAELARFWEEVQPALTAAWDGMTGVVKTDMAAIWSIVQPAIQALVTFWTDNWGTISRVLSTAWDVMTLGIRVAWEAFQGILVAGLRIMGGDWEGAWQAIQDHFGRAWEQIKGTMGAAISLLMEAMRNAGIGLLNMLKAGLDAKWAEVIGSVQAGVSKIAALLPHSLADEGPLSRPVDWNDVIVANLPSRLDFARTSVFGAAGYIASQFDTMATAATTSSDAIGDAFESIAESVDPTVTALDALATQLLAEIDTANAYTNALNAIPTSITTTISTSGTPGVGGTAQILNGGASGGGGGGGGSPAPSAPPPGSSTVSTGGTPGAGGTAQIINGGPTGGGIPGITAPPQVGGNLPGWGWAVHLMAAGGAGIVTSPTMFVAGEAGPEPFAFGTAGLRALAGAGVGGGGSSEAAAGDVFMDGEKVGTVVWRFLKGKRQAGANLGFT